MFTWASIESLWDILLRELAKKTKRNTNKDRSQNNYENAYCPTHKLSDTI